MCGKCVGTDWQTILISFCFAPTYSQPIKIAPLQLEQAKMKGPKGLSERAKAASSGFVREELLS